MFVNILVLSCFRTFLKFSTFPVIFSGLFSILVLFIITIGSLTIEFYNSMKLFIAPFPIISMKSRAYIQKFHISACSLSFYFYLQYKLKCFPCLLKYYGSIDLPSRKVVTTTLIQYESHHKVLTKQLSCT